MAPAINHLRRKLSVPQYARQLGVADKKIIGWIQCGELRTVNLASSASGRPRYAIDLADVAAFEATRQVIPDGGLSTTAKLRRRAAQTVKEYF